VTKFSSRNMRGGKRGKKKAPKNSTA